MNHVTEKKLNNKGFSLVELIIVIAIMAVLVGVLAPQYLKYVKTSKISADSSNAEAIATAVNVAIADGSISVSGTATIDAAALGTGGTYENKIANLKAFPVSKVNSAYVWKVTMDATGVTKIELGTSTDLKEIYPDNTAYTTANS